MIGNVTPEMPMRYARIFLKSKLENKELILSENQENIIGRLTESRENFFDKFYVSTKIIDDVMKTFEQLSYIEQLEVIKESVTLILKNSLD